MTEPQPTSRQCSTCQAGVMHLRYTTYLTWLGEELIAAPNFPVWMCDICGRCLYDERAVSMLSALLNPNAGTPSRKRPALRPSQPRRNLTRPSTTE